MTSATTSSSRVELLRRRTPLDELDRLRRVLVRLPNPLGDTVMCTAALRALRLGLPGAEIHLQGSELQRGLLRGLESYDVFHALGGRGLAGIRQRARALRALAFDAALILPDSPRSAADAFFARIPRRVGYARDPVRRALLTRALEPPRERGRRVPISMLERYLLPVRVLGLRDAGDALELRVHEEARVRARERFRAAGADPSRPLLLITPGASFGPSKLWPPRHYAQAALEIQRRFGLAPVIAPAPSAEEVAVARQVNDAAGGACAVLEPEPDLEVFKALVEQATLLLTNDTGPRHVAVALDRPSITLMGSTDPRHTAHRLERQRVLTEDVACRPCGQKVCAIGDHRCLERLAPERAVEAAGELLAAA